jgi:hypothetical protein
MRRETRLASRRGGHYHVFSTKATDFRQKNDLFRRFEAAGAELLDCVLAAAPQA